MDIVNREERGGEHFARDDQMAQVSAGEILAGIARALWIDRFWIACILGFGEVHTALHGQRGVVAGDPDNGLLPSGQVAATINKLESCQDLISRIVTEAEARIDALAALRAVPAN